MAGYCSSDDLMLGKIPLPAYIDPQKQVNDAQDEIDSKLGFIYVTPFDVTEDGPLARPSRLLLKRINVALATGRLILAIASPEENNSLHAYGWSLVREANAALSAIVSGEIVLEGAQLNPDSVVETAGAPLINNLDSESNVEAFYDRMANPNYSFLVPVDQYSSPDRLVN